MRSYDVIHPRLCHDMVWVRDFKYVSTHPHPLTPNRKCLCKACKYPRKMWKSLDILGNFRELATLSWSGTELCSNISLHHVRSLVCSSSCVLWPSYYLHPCRLHQLYFLSIETPAGWLQISWRAAVWYRANRVFEDPLTVPAILSNHQSPPCVFPIQITAFKRARFKNDPLWAISHFTRSTWCLLRFYCAGDIFMQLSSNRAGFQTSFYNAVSDLICTGCQTDVRKFRTVIWKCCIWNFQITAIDLNPVLSIKLHLGKSRKRSNKRHSPELSKCLSAIV